MLRECRTCDQHQERVLFYATVCVFLYDVPFSSGLGFFLYVPPVWFKIKLEIE